MNASPLLAVTDLTVGYGHVGVLEGVNLDIMPGSIVALVGSNGAGKSTLLRAISGLLKPSGGSISFDGADLTGARPDRVVQSGILHVAEGRRLFRSQSVANNLTLGLYGDRAGPAEVARRYDQIYTLFPMLRERLDQPAGILSGGQQQMLAIAQALMRQPRLLMLDEPSLGLAPVVVDQVLDAIVTLRRAGVTILLVEQMVDRALEIADTGYVMQNGRIIGSGPAQDLLGSDLVRNAYVGAAGARGTV